MAHAHRYRQPLLARIQNGDIDPSFVILIGSAFHEATFRDKQQAA
jgi:hypothetical protein